MDVGRRGAKLLVASAAGVGPVAVIIYRGGATYCGAGITTEPGAMVCDISGDRSIRVAGGACWLNTPGTYSISSICCVHFASFNCDTSAKAGLDSVGPAPLAADADVSLAYLSRRRLCSSTTGSLRHGLRLRVS